MQISRFQQLPHSQASRQDCPLGRHWLLFLPGVVYNKGGALQTGAKILNRKPVPKVALPNKSSKQATKPIFHLVLARMNLVRCFAAGTAKVHCTELMSCRMGFRLFLEACADASWQAASLPFPDVTGMKSYASQIRTSYQKAWRVCSDVVERCWKLSSCNWSVGQCK